jgi:mannosyltransferase
MDAVIATSEEAAGYVDNVVATIPHGVDCDRFQPGKDRHTAMRAFDIPGEYGISLIGRIRPEKGSDLFVDAMIRLLPKYPAFIACIAGKATVEHELFRQQLQAKIEKAGLTDRFVWLGEVAYDRMPQFHSAMSLCVAPARYEGFGLVPLEAMACGVPVVASQTGCYRDVIQPGVTGSLVPCNDAEALISALDQLMATPKNCLKWAEQGDHWSSSLILRISKRFESWMFTGICGRRQPELQNWPFLGACAFTMIKSTVGQGSRCRSPY